VLRLVREHARLPLSKSWLMPFTHRGYMVWPGCSYNYEARTAVLEELKTGVKERRVERNEREKEGRRLEGEWGLFHDNRVGYALAHARALFMRFNTLCFLNSRSFCLFFMRHRARNFEFLFGIFQLK
jgi:hypothetical protein